MRRREHSNFSAEKYACASKGTSSFVSDILISMSIKLIPPFQPRKKILRILYGSMFFFSFHVYIFLYVQSTFISKSVSENYLGLIYGVGAAISLLTLFYIPKIFGRISDRQLALTLISIEGLLCLILAYSNFAWLTVLAFILQQALVVVLSFAIDVLIEDFSQNKDVGMVRGLTFTAGNIALVISPLLAGYIGSKYGFGTIFFLSILFLVPFFIMIFSLRRNLHEPTYHSQSILTTIRRLRSSYSEQSRNITLIFMINFLLQFFYTWIIIYSPLYMIHQGFNWDQIGLIFSIMLLPFLFLELPLGRYAGVWFSEKEFLAIGFVIMSLSTMSLAFISSPSIVVWAIALLMTRVGASCVEIMSEIYFFKLIKKTDTPLISLFRFTRPLSLLVAPIAAVFTIMVVGEAGAFLVLGLILLTGLKFVYALGASHHEAVA